jgi:hypothetical protein
LVGHESDIACRSRGRFAVAALGHASTIAAAPLRLLKCDVIALAIFSVLVYGCSLGRALIAQETSNTANALSSSGQGYKR